MSTPPWVTTQHQTAVDYSQESYDLSTLDDDAVEAKKEHKKTSIIGGAALAGTGLGLAIAGPIIGLVGGVTAATLATRDSKAGDAARYSGDVVLSVGDQMRDIDEKHKVVEKTKWGFGAIVGKAKEIDQNHGVVEKTKAGMSNAANKVKEVEAENGYFNSFVNKLKRQPDCNYTPWPDRDKTDDQQQEKTQDNYTDTSNNVGLGKHFNYGLPNPFRKKPDCNYTAWPEK